MTSLLPHPHLFPRQKEAEYAQNPPAGPTPSSSSPPGTNQRFTLLPTNNSSVIEQLRVWERTLPDGRGNGIAGLSIAWTNHDEKRVGMCEGAASKEFRFQKGERIQIMYVYAGDDGVEGLWFVTDAQRSFFPGRSSTRYDMGNLGSGILVGFEGWEEMEEGDGVVVGLLALGATFR
ncbi:hypothetical protein FE257_008545 [Aspergillus nanangensis]|uniref:Uncharacterized protein n=1 Tax=Aspergillus nanangensis TaxID=2582783 RepID=A0AAD4GUN0_ASPNN|nr:hypothetical protein FE257_008545 [Aspergillus nanangensis]